MRRNFLKRLFAAIPLGFLAKKDGVKPTLTKQDYLDIANTYVSKQQAREMKLFKVKATSVGDLWVKDDPRP